MISEILVEHQWLWPAVWQSTTMLAVGLGASLSWRSRAVRAHQLLLMASIAALVVPGLSHLVKQHQWGLLRARPEAVEVEKRPIPTAENLPTLERATEPRTQGATTTLMERPTDTHTTSVPSIAWKSLILPLWIVLGTALLVRLALRFLLGYRLARRSVPHELPMLAGPIERAKAKLDLTCDIQLRRSAETHSPVIWCWGAKPILLIPAQAGEHIDWDSVVCHELAHWKKRDHLSGLWAELMVCVLPWNPLSWLAQRRLVRLSEEACDDWVMASGQVGTRYARTLLGLTPQGRAALIPAVVTSRRSLATRVRRILADRCASPYSGVHWTLAAIGVVACLTVTLAFAQARPTQSNGTIRAQLAHGAVIEQLAPAATIKGTVLDCDGKPTSNVCVFSLPMTLCDAEVRYADGHFELPWSPAWFEAGQPLHLVAIAFGYRNQAAFVTITDPTAPVTIRLEPAFTLQATVVDPDGQRIPRYTATLSLFTEFKCQAPIDTTMVGIPRVELFSPIPFGPHYRLTIEADGYQSKSVTVDASDKNADIIDLGEITLHRTTPGDATAISRAPDRDLREAFLELYRLNDGEVLKLVKAPFVLGRQECLLQEPSVGRGVQFRWGWRGELEKPRYGFSGPSRLSSILRLMLVIPKHDFSLPKELDICLPGGGDWVVRENAPLEDQMAALEEIILAETNRSIHFQKRRTQREVVVARGRYRLTSHPNGKQPNHVHLSWDGTVDEHHKQADSLQEIFEWLERDIAMKIVDETDPAPATVIPYVATNDLAWIGDLPDVKREHLDDLLDNLAKTTNLTFTVETRPAEIWFVTEEKAVAAARL